MIWGSRILKEYPVGKSKMNNYKTKCKDFYIKEKNKNELVIRDYEDLKHFKYRELQRYGTLSVDEKEITSLICDGSAVIIKEDEDTVTAVVRHLNRYYAAVMNKRYKFIKTLLPDTIKDFLDYVQQLIDKENSAELSIAA